MFSINSLKKEDDKILVIGNHTYIIQSILDFDYLCGKDEPSVRAIIGNEDGKAKYFWGNKEILVPVYKELASVKNMTINWFLNLTSGRRVLASGVEIMDMFKDDLRGGAFFAENVPEKHSIELYNIASKRDNFVLLGPATVGAVIPGFLKLGPIGGVSPEQIESAKLYEKGDVSVMSASGGMTNELINLVINEGKRISFALSFGGDRFPLLTPEEAVFIAESDKHTDVIVYYGELGGFDEYKLIDYKKQGKLTKPIVMHIAGTVADLFEESPQFGHAKAKASRELEKAGIKREKLKEAGFYISESFSEIPKLLNDALNDKKAI